MTADCVHPGAPVRCPLCAIGEGFTEAGQSALDLLDDLIGSAVAADIPGLEYARKCVIACEWKTAWGRQNQKNADAGGGGDLAKPHPAP